MIKFNFIVFIISLLLSHASLANDAYLKQLPEDIILGETNSPVIMIEYSSFSCPHCAYFHKNVFDNLKEKYIDTGKLKYIHRDYPLDKAAFSGSVLAHCGNTKEYHAFLEVLFSKQENWVFQKNYLEILENIAKLGGISSEKFHECLANKDIEKKILESRLTANNELNVKATPTFFINGKSYPGMHDLQFFEKIIDQLLLEK